ncbi:MAG: HAMP domain-containing histidine kinase [Schleiferiaceae bacterium]|nr:HAMP domain-containing histidine kinase [Schleiferiaceae bacterium]
MTLKNRITLNFTLFAALVVAVICVVVYSISKNYNHREFTDRLRQRAEIAATVKLEADELNSKIYAQFQRRHIQTLPGEVEYFLPINLITEQLLQQLPDKLFVPPYFIAEVFEEGESEIVIDDRTYLGIIYQDNEGDFIVISSAVDLYGQSKLRNLAQTLVVIFLISIGLLYITGSFYAEYMLRPLKEFVHQINRIHVSNLSEKLPVPESKDEIAQMTRAFNLLLERMETAFEMQNAFVGNASHELKNPLTAILGTAEIALNRDRDNQAYQKALQDIQTEALRLENITLRLLELARISYQPVGLQNQELNLLQLLEKISANYKKIKPECHIAFDNQAPRPVIVGSEELLRLALVNLIDNACKFSNNQPVSVTLKKDQQHLVIAIEDHGIGIAPEDISRLFQPFYRGKNTRSFAGYGIGLSLTKRIIDLHSGEIVVHSSDSGTRFELKLVLP